MIDPTEIAAYEAACARFVQAYDDAESLTADLDDAVVDFLQAANRLKLLVTLDLPKPLTLLDPEYVEKHRDWKLAKAKGYTGDVCPGCGSFTIQRKGTCLSCDSCSWDTGCG